MIQRKPDIVIALQQGNSETRVICFLMNAKL